MTARTSHVLHPGDIVCAERGEQLETLLGSCIAIVLTDPRRTIGAMCHIVHARPALGIADNPGAYADAAINEMYARLRKHGFNPKLCDAFVYGGGNMFPAQFTQSHVGEANSNWVLDRLRHDGVRIILHDTGGNAYRRLTWTIGPLLPVITSVVVQEN